MHASECNDGDTGATECATPATCFMDAQAYLAQTSFGSELGPDDRVKIVCSRSNCNFDCALSPLGFVIGGVRSNPFLPTEQTGVTLTSCGVRPSVAIGGKADLCRTSLKDRV